MSSETVAPDAPDLALRFDHVSKVYCGSLKLTRNYAIRDVMWPRHDRPSRLRPGEWVVLRDISFEVRARQTVLILGVSGSGKTALADLISGRRTPDAGTIVRHGSVGMIAEGKYGQNPLMKLHEYVRLMASLQGVQATDLSPTVERILEWTGLTGYRDTTIFDLPKPLMKPLSRVGSLLTDHDIYVFDNYSAFGDSELGLRLAARFAEIQSTRACVILARGPLVPDRVDHVLILHGGEIIYSGDPEAAIRVYDQFVDHAQVVHKRRGAGTGRGGAMHHQASPSVDDALVLIRDLLGSGGPTWSIDKALTRLSAPNQPFLIGPCLTNTSWEVLFWLPFLKWMRRQLGAQPPAAAVSRGAGASWYEQIASTYVDIYDLIPAEEFKARNEARARSSSLKQMGISAFERELLEKAAVRCGFASVEILHPSLLLGLAAQIWRGRASLAELGDRSIYERLPITDEALSLPGDYVLACFSFTKHFPDVAENRALIADAIRIASARTSVIVLGVHDWLWSEGRLTDARHKVEQVNPAADPRRHRQIEATVVGHARAVIGTINGPVTLAPFSGVPAMCLHPPAGGMLEFNLGALRQAAEHLRDTALKTSAIGTVTPDDIGQWLDDVLQNRPSDPVSAGRSSNERA